MVGNKCDLDADREVLTLEGKELAKTFHASGRPAPFFESSAKERINVDGKNLKKDWMKLKKENWKNLRKWKKDEWKNETQFTIYTSTNKTEAFLALVKEILDTQKGGSSVAKQNAKAHKERGGCLLV